MCLLHILFMFVAHIFFPFFVRFFSIRFVFIASIFLSYIYNIWLWFIWIGCTKQMIVNENNKNPHTRYNNVLRCANKRFKSEESKRKNKKNTNQTETCINKYTLSLSRTIREYRMTKLQQSYLCFCWHLCHFHDEIYLYIPCIQFFSCVNFLHYIFPLFYVFFFCFSQLNSLFTEHFLYNKRLFTNCDNLKPEQFVHHLDSWDKVE